MIDIAYVSSPIKDRERNDFLYSGGLIVFQDVPVMLELNEILRDLIGESFGMNPLFNIPLSRSEFEKNLKEIQRGFIKDVRIYDLFKKALEQTGMSLEHNYYDNLFLRYVPPFSDKTNLFRGHIGGHRDTWGSNVQHQINWWSSVYPVSKENTIVFYPKYWDEPVENDTDRWYYKEFCKARERAMLNDKISHIHYPYAPSATKSMEDSGAISIIVNPGELLCFSSSHLHSGTPVPESYNLFNIELRSFTGADVNSDLQNVPVNIDNSECEPNYDGFKCFVGDGKFIFE